MEDILKMTLADILRDSNYKLTQFSTEKVDFLEENITVRETRGKDTPYITCLVRKKEIKLTPEEVVRQLYVMVLTQDFGYPTDRMELEYAVSFGREKKRADIVIFDRDKTTTPYIMVELKKPKLKDGKEQLKSYCNATGAPIEIGVTVIPFHSTTAKTPTILKTFQEYRELTKSYLTFLKSVGLLKT